MAYGCVAANNLEIAKISNFIFEMLLGAQKNQ